MAFLNCDCYECIHNKDGACGSDYVSVSRITSNEFRNGKRISYPACGDYKEVEEYESL